MTTILEIARSAAPLLLVDPPSALFPALTVEQQRYVSILDSVGLSLARAYDWPVLRGTLTFLLAGGSAQAHVQLPGGWNRWVPDSALIGDNPLVGPLSPNDWRGKRGQYASGTPTWWYWAGNVVQVWPPAAGEDVGDEVQVDYCTDYWLSGSKSTCTTDHDVVLLDAEALKYALVSEWKKLEGFNDWQADALRARELGLAAWQRQSQTAPVVVGTAAGAMASQSPRARYRAAQAQTPSDSTLAAQVATLDALVAAQQVQIDNLLNRVQRELPVINQGDDGKFLKVVSGVGAWIAEQFSNAWADITDKPTFADVATSGQYHDLVGKPDIPSGDEILPTEGTTGYYLQKTADGRAWAEVQQGGGGGGDGMVSSDATLTGDGSSGSPLGVANPFTAADETKLDGLQDLSDELLAAFLVAFRGPSFTRTFVQSNTSAENEAATSTNNTAKFGVTDFLILDKDNEADLIDSVVAGDFLFAMVGEKFLIAQVAGVEDESDNDDVRLLWYKTPAYSSGLDEYRQIGTGNGTIQFARNPLLRDLENLADVAAAAAPKLRDAVEDVIDSDFKAAVQGSNEDEDLGSFQRVAAGLASQGDSRFSYQAPTLTLSVAADSDYQSEASQTLDAKLWRAFQERAWIRFGNGWNIEIISLTNRYLSNDRAQYQVNSLKVISGAVVGLNAHTSMKIIGEDVHRGQLVDQSYRDQDPNLAGKGGTQGQVWTRGSGDENADWGDNKAIVRRFVNTDIGTSVENIATGLDDDDLVTVWFEYTDASSTATGARAVTNRFGDFDSDDRVVMYLQGNNEAGILSKSGSNLQCKRGGGLTSLSTVVLVQKADVTTVSL